MTVRSSGRRRPRGRAPRSGGVPLEVGDDLVAGHEAVGVVAGVGPSREPHGPVRGDEAEAVPAIPPRLADPAALQDDVVDPQARELMADRTGRRTRPPPPGRRRAPWARSVSGEWFRRRKRVAKLRTASSRVRALARASAHAREQLPRRRRRGLDGTVGVADPGCARRAGCRGAILLMVSSAGSPRASRRSRRRAGRR